MKSIKAAAAAIGQWRKEFGPAVGLLYIAHRLLAGISRGHARILPYRLFAQPIGATSYQHVRDDAGTQVLSVEADDPLIDSFPRNRTVNDRRFAQGHECWVALVKGRFAGHIWIARDRYDEDEVRCQYLWPRDPPCVWDFDVYVEPGYRMGRTMGRLWKGVDAALRSQEIHWSLSRISMFNPASSAAHSSLAAVEIGRAVFVVLWSAQLALSSMKPYVCLTLGNSSKIPRFQLSAPPHPLRIHDPAPTAPGA